MMDDWKKDLLSEKSLREAYNKSKVLARSRFNWIFFRLSALAFVLVGAVWTIRGSAANSKDALVLMSDTAFDLTVQILGFLIGGFAIFATISDSKLMVRLAQTPMQKTGLSVFKTIFFNFISVFYIYVVTLSLAVAIRVLGSLHLFDLSFLPRHLEIAAVSAINSVAFAIIGSAVVLSILRLKSFIWNIYQAYLTLLIVGEIPQPKSDEAKR